MGYFRFRRHAETKADWPRSFPRLEELESRTLLSVDVGIAKAGLGYTGYIPPDTIGAVGPSYFVEAVNLTMGIYAKSTGNLVSSKSLSSFFSPLGGVMQGSDPSVTYDTYADRFVVGMIDYNGTTLNPSRFDLAVSTTSDPTGSWIFQRYDMTNDSAGGPYLSDYPRLGYNADAYVVTFNMFKSSFQHVDTLSIDRNNLTSGFVHVWPTGTVTSPGMAPAVVHDGSPGGPVWLVGTGNGSNIKVIKMTNELSSNPTTQLYTVNVPSYGTMPAPHQPGSTMSWTFDTRILNAAMRDGLLVAAHNTGSGGFARARWYEFDTTGATPTLVQSGSIAPASTDTYFPTIDINTADSLGMTYIESSSSEYMSTYVTGRTTSDPTGTMQDGVNPAVLKGSTSYTINRAGDYSGTSVDPSDGTTFWSANEYKGISTWNTGFASYSPSQVVGTTHYGVIPDTNPVTAGTPFTITVEALDSNNNVVTDYQGTVHFTSNDPNASLPGDYTFTTGDNGVHDFSVTLETAGTKTVTATDTVNSGIGGTATLTVTPAAASSFLVQGFPLSTVAGIAHNFKVTARDPYGNVATDYTGTVTFSSSDPQASLPNDSQLTNGTGTFSATLYTAGRQSITASDSVDGSITGTQSNILVTPAALSQFAVLTDAADPDVAGTLFDVTVIAQDPYGNTVTNYQGTVTFSSGDPYGATLPPDYAFQPSDLGQVTFYGITALYTAGTWDVTATDTVSGITGSAFVNVQAAPAPTATPIPTTWGPPTSAARTPPAPPCRRTTPSSPAT
jgi:hypothetical protein